MFYQLEATNTQSSKSSPMISMTSITISAAVTTQRLLLLPPSVIGTTMPITTEASVSLLLSGFFLGSSMMKL